MTKNDAIVAYRHISDAKLAKLDTPEKFTAIRAIGKLKPTATAFDDFIKEARERLKPENWADTEAKAQKFDTLDESEKAAVNAAIAAYNKVVAECAAKELSEEWEAGYDRLSEDAFGRLLESNPDWSVAQILAVQLALA